eukprot:TRINITY_DN7738_c0_g1_i1.p1 TRINITY_DN7738_c0_g1~~TRINITY_DN7738_c0_g1_i1.p1  ORF type:complete len:223 (+),score=23.11 TRINITY_DN7738_c0_g1_i1:145-813(+)
MEAPFSLWLNNTLARNKQTLYVDKEGQYYARIEVGQVYQLRFEHRGIDMVYHIKEHHTNGNTNDGIKPLVNHLWKTSSETLFSINLQRDKKAQDSPLWTLSFSDGICTFFTFKLSARLPEQLLVTALFTPLLPTKQIFPVNAQHAPQEIVMSSHYPTNIAGAQSHPMDLDEDNQADVFRYPEDTSERLPSIFAPELAYGNTQSHPTIFTRYYNVRYLLLSPS